jgi:hypothetical protein
MEKVQHINITYAFDRSVTHAIEGKVGSVYSKSFAPRKIQQKHFHILHQTIHYV